MFFDTHKPKESTEKSIKDMQRKRQKISNQYQESV